MADFASGPPLRVSLYWNYMLLADWVDVGLYSTNCWTFINSENLYSATSRNSLRRVPSLATTKETSSTLRVQSSLVGLVIRLTKLIGERFLLYIGQRSRLIEVCNYFETKVTNCAWIKTRLEDTQRWGAIALTIRLFHAPCSAFGP